MDFRQFGSTPVSKPEAGSASTAAPAPAPTHSGKRKGLSDKLPTWVNVLYVVILFGIAVLLILVALSVARSDGGSGEAKLVDKTKYQAVFLNNGQVYFGNVASLNSEYVKLTNVYYLTQNSGTATNTSTTANSDYTLVKLGCQQIHYPNDQMVVNRSQVTFWENLNKDGKVAQSIEEFKKQNPNGPDCTQVTNQTQSTSNSNTQGSNSNTQNTTTTNP